MNELEKINELEELIELAEKVSANIDANARRANNLFFYQIISTVIFIILVSAGFIFYLKQDHKFYENFDVISGFFFIFSFLGFIFFFVKLSLERKRMRDEVKNESLILNNLLNMIHSYKEIVYSKLSIVKRALLDMRLSKIRFNSKRRLFEIENEKAAENKA